MTGYKREHDRRGRRSQGGFTLIELMVVVVVVAVLAAIAYPSYQQYARETKRADAHTALTRMAQLQEKFFGDNNIYATTATALGYAASPAGSPDGYWAVTVNNIDPAAAQEYSLSAAPAGGHQDPGCTTITLDSAGMRDSTPAGGDCW